MKLKDMKLFDLLQRSMDEPQNRADKLSRATINSAKRFVFDATASEFMGSLLRRAPLELLRQHRFAQAPFDATWIEIDHRAYFERGLRLPRPNDGTVEDERFGALIVRGHVFMAISDTNGKMERFPCMFRLHEPMSFEYELDLAQRCGVSRLGLRQSMLGSVAGRDDDWWMSTEAADICRSHKMMFLPNYDDIPPAAMAELMKASVGNLKLILAMLLLLVRPHRSFVVSEVGPRRALVKGKATVLKDHHVLRLRVEHEDPVTRYLAHEGSGRHVRLHDVRGHWAQSRKRGHGCDHRWGEIDDRLFQCVACGAKRWWKKDHRRGLKNLGKVTAEYEVTR